MIIKPWDFLEYRLAISIAIVVAKAGWEIVNAFRDN